MDVGEDVALPDDRPIIALDLASRFGWAEGVPGRKPTSGADNFAPKGSSHEAIFWGALKFADARFQSCRYRMVLIEAPLASSFLRGRTNVNTSRLLFGLPAVIGAVAHGRGIYSVKTANVKDVRMHFIGRNMKSGEAERAVKATCRMLGWIDKSEPLDDNRADALALWSFGCAAVAPLSAVRVEPLFIPPRTEAS